MYYKNKAFWKFSLYLLHLILIPYKYFKCGKSVDNFLIYKVNCLIKIIGIKCLHNKYKNNKNRSQKFKHSTQIVDKTKSPLFSILIHGLAKIMTLYE